MPKDDGAVWPPFPYSTKEFGPRGEAVCLNYALEALRVGADEGRPERATAIDRITELATALNYSLALERSAPRLKDVLDQLAGLSEAAARLQEAWASTDKMSEYVLNLGVRVYGQKTGKSESELKRQLLISDSGQPLWPQALSDFVECIRTGEEILVKTQGSGDPERPDVGGQANLYVRLFGHPKWHFASACWIIFEEYRPGTTSGFERGPFADFMRHVYAYATDRSPDGDGAGLERWLKKVARFYGRRDDLLARGKELAERISEIREQHGAAGIDPGKRPDFAKELAALEKEKQAIETELGEWEFELQTGRLFEDRKDRIVRWAERFKRESSRQTRRAQAPQDPRP